MGSFMLLLRYKTFCITVKNINILLNVKFFIKSLVSNFMKICPVAAALTHTTQL